MIPDLTGQSARASEVQRTLRWVQDVEYQFRSHRPGSRQSVYNPWMPFQPADFVALMTDVVAEANGPRFLDIGCGPGTKLTLAEEIFGLEGVGIEVDADMAQAASVRHQVVHMDALGWERYGDFDIIWLYRPFNDPHFEYQLEQHVMEQMKVGAILVGGSWEMEQPPPWITIVDDWEARRGAWMKPGI
jgi:SAM-dependent methyltransferase